MASYFDTAEESHLELIPESLRSATDIEAIAEITEAEVLSRFTGEVPADYPILVSAIPYGGAKVDDYRYVFLRGYEVDADDADVGADLKVALRRTISRVMVRVIRSWEKDDRVLTEGNGRGSKTLRATAASRFPKGWDSLLRPFDTRPVSYVL